MSMCENNRMPTDAISSKIANLGLLCAIMVMLIHSTRGDEVGSVGWWWTTFVQNGICQMAVPFFFLVSGFFLAKHMEEEGWWKRETLKRIRTLLLPFLLWNMIYALCSLVFRFMDGSQPTTWKTWARFVVASIGIVPFGGFHMGALWFVRALLVLVLISPILKRLATPRGLSALFILNIVLDPYPFEGRFGLFRYFAMSMVSFCGMAWFTLGIYIRQKASKGFTAKWHKDAIYLAIMLISGGGYDS